MVGSRRSSSNSDTRDECETDVTDSLFDDTEGRNSTTLDDDIVNEIPVSGKQRQPSLGSVNTAINMHFPKEPVQSKYNRYRLKSIRLCRFVLARSEFELKLVERLGNGANSYVYDCTLTAANGYEKHVALKIPSSRNRVKYLEREALFMLDLKQYRAGHRKQILEEDFPFVEAYGLCYLNRKDFAMMRKDDELPCLAMKKMDCTLSKFIRSCRGSAKPECVVIGVRRWWQLCGSLLQALEVLRTMRAVHCDLKPDNVMVGGIYTGEIQFKVSDFSSAAYLSEMNGRQPEMTVQFSAPELLSSQYIHPSGKTDLYSCGLILLTAATGRAPYQAYSYDQLYLLTLAADNKVLELLERESVNILRKNRAVAGLLCRIIRDRCDLDEAVSYYESNGC